MRGKYPGFCVPVFLLCVLAFVGFTSPAAEASRICTFKGTVVGHGWRTMIVKSNGQCATVNVGWRTRYIPNRRPCLGERVAVDFTLEEGYMKATKVVSLTPTPAPSRCYPPAPPRTADCRQVMDDRTIGECPRPEGVCSRTPPPHVTGQPQAARPPARRTAERPRPKPEPEKPKPDSGQRASTPPPQPQEPSAQKEKETEQPELKTLTGEVVASSPTRLSIRVTKDDDTSELEQVTVGLKTLFEPFRRPAVGEKVEVTYTQEAGGKFGRVVKVIQ